MIGIVPVILYNAGSEQEILVWRSSVTPQPAVGYKSVATVPNPEKMLAFHKPHRLQSGQPHHRHQVAGKSLLPGDLPLRHAPGDAALLRDLLSRAVERGADGRTAVHSRKNICRKNKMSLSG